MTLSLASYPSLEALPSSAQAILDGPGSQDLFASRPWFETFVSGGLSAGARPIFFVLEDEAGRAQALLPCQGAGAESGLGHPAVASLTSFYSCDFRPLIAPALDPDATAFALGRALAMRLAREPVIRIDSLDSTLGTLGPLLDGLKRPGRALLRYEHFGRWWEPLEGIGFDAYLAARDGALREVVRRKGNRLARENGSLTLVASDEVEKGIADYEAVYARSWKEPEPFPDFQPMLMRALARAGWLRLAICAVEGRPIAAQLWVVVAGRATVLKLAHDKAFDRLSPGTLLTSFAIRALMERDRITALDFGRGDDPYKRSWTTRRTPHIGVLWTSLVRRPIMAGRHLLGELFRRRGRGSSDGERAS